MKQCIWGALKCNRFNTPQRGRLKIPFLCLKHSAPWCSECLNDDPLLTRLDILQFDISVLAIHCLHFSCKRISLKKNYCLHVIFLSFIKNFDHTATHFILSHIQLFCFSFYVCVGLLKIVGPVWDVYSPVGWLC